MVTQTLWLWDLSNNTVLVAVLLATWDLGWIVHNLVNTILYS